MNMDHQSYLVDYYIVGGNPCGKESKATNEWSNGVWNPGPKETTAGNDHEELVPTHRPAVDGIHGASGVQTVHNRASDEGCRPL